MHKAPNSGRVRLIARSLFAAVILVPAIAAAQYSQHNLVSDGFVAADHTDPLLVNPWGISFSPSSPFWIANNGSATSTLYDGNGTSQPLVVGIPDGSTGTVYNGTGDFSVTNGASSGAARFLFADEAGGISGWSPGVDPTHALTAVDNSSTGASYKGLAIQTGGSGSRLYAANFARGAVDVFDGSFGYMGSFTDTGVDPGFSPFNVQSIGSSVYVTYAQLGSDGDEVDGAGLGFVDQFDRDGHLIRRLASHGVLNAPWGITQAPSNFGAFSNDILVGNFGDGRINAFNATTGAFVGTISDVSGNAIENPGLWAITFGNGGNGGNTNSLYFTVGVDHEQHGLFARLDTVPEPASLVILSVGVLVAFSRKKRA